eukprot:Sspe_Gene.34669::Locus_16834_Transcript_1_4_Confidence_0.500_Length_1900::g.34669::m.34669/K04708/E1.1.1.102; 3-dehydrosphinganine reductase
MGWLAWLLGAWAVGVVVPLALRILRKPKSIANKVVFITGGSEGIGLCLAEEVARRRATVVLFSRSEEKLRRAVDHIKKTTKNENIFFESMDVTQDDSVKRALDDATTAHGAPDILLSCAGTSYPGYFLDQEVGTFQRTIDLNYMGTVRVVKNLTPKMIAKGGGHIMIVSSAAGVVSFIGYSSYSPSKFALRGFADSLRNELCGFNINVSICYPPDTDTPGFKREMELKPKETLACFPADPYTPESVASKSINSMLQGDYHIQSPDVLQNLLVSSMSGVTPRVHFLLEVAAQPLLALVQLPFYLWFDFQARKYAKRRSAQHKPQ